ncbi:SDR family NAD(P)-dependent oxidoreductase [Verrucomicrobium sp. BvORR106]|uniref:SDR family NAD(P)-dependent oxidoreductase n=1 Tax=Verrucomicrobium sp. BvORR106 TaxID=1403819 RepID=UPI00056E20B8|nr:SDR family NAD(P)-dependent oxidoreductase [Verrucomicrobium sp. BvORR106]
MNTVSPRTAVIAGASSGIGLALARLLASRGYRLVLLARRRELLEQIAEELPVEVVIKVMDVGDANAPEAFSELLDQQSAVDQIYLSAGTGHLNPSLDWALEEETFRVNALGFAGMAAAAYRYFERQGRGHLVGITSIAALLGSPEAPAYNASKACASRYLDGLRMRARAAKLPVYVTDILPGFVDTAMMKAEKPFWVASPEKAAAQIVSAVDRKKGRAYVSRRWGVVALILRLLMK